MTFIIRGVSTASLIPSFNKIKRKKTHKGTAALAILLMATMLVAITRVNPVSAQTQLTAVTFIADGDRSFQEAVLSGRAQVTLTVDNLVYYLPHTFFWQVGSRHYVVAPSQIIDSVNPQTRYNFFNWVDGEWDPYRWITVNATPAVYRVIFMTEHYLTMSSNIQIQQTGGVPVDQCLLWPGSEWHREYASVDIYTGTPQASQPSNDPSYDRNSWIFNRWVGQGNGSYTGPDQSAQVTLNAPVTETAYWRYPYHVYDDPFGWSDSNTYSWYKANTRASVSDTGFMSHFGDIYGQYSTAWTVAGVGHDLDESNGNFEIRMHFTIYGLAPPYSVGDRATFCAVGLSVMDLDENEIVLEEVAQEFYEFVNWQTFTYSTTVTLENHNYRFFGWAQASASTGSAHPHDAEWDFEDDYFIYLRWLEIRRTSQPDFGLGIVGIHDTIRIPEIWIPPGDPVEVPITVHSINDFNSEVALHVEGIPPETTYELSNPVVHPHLEGMAESILTLTTSPATPQGYYTLKITGTSTDGRTHTTAMSLHVNPAHPTTVDVDPDTLNPKSKGRAITAYIEPPEGHTVNDMDLSTIMLDDTVPIDPAAPVTVGDFDDDGIPDLMVHFKRTEVIAYVLVKINMPEPADQRFVITSLTVNGLLKDGTPFQGSDIIRIRLK
jgi:hypothetical protein